MDSPEPFLVETSEARWRCFGFGDPDQLRNAGANLSALLLEARQAKEKAYAPYSRFRVGAALLMNGEVFAGANVENASYGGTLCAERTAIATAVAKGGRRLEVIAVSTDAVPGSPIETRSPCGLCRQVMSEFASSDLIVLLDAGDTQDGMLLGEAIRFESLLPWRFRLF